jgi:anti-anti-sigma regulatory factor
VRLNISKLEFIDASAIRLLIQTVGDARIKGWEFQIDRDVAPAVMRVFRLVHMDRYLATSGAMD